MNARPRVAVARCAWPAVLFGFVAGSALAHEPRAAFTLKSGWVECSVTQDGKPVANALLAVLDGHGARFADGETDDSGLAQFPAPDGGSFTVEIKTGKATSDPIRLTKAGANIQPSRALLSYGLRPCCRFLVKRDTSWKTAGPAVPGSDLLLTWVLGAVVICSVLGVFVLRQLPRRNGQSLSVPQ